MASSIGAIAFDDLQGALQPKCDQLEVIVLPGVDGEILRDTGNRADLTSVETLRYLANRAAAVSAISSYIALKDGAAYEVIQHGQSFGNFRVLGVQPLPLAAVANVIGSITANPGIALRCVWTILSTT